MSTVEVHPSRGLVNILMDKHDLPENDWELIREAAIYENNWELIGDFYVRNSLEEKMLNFFDQLRIYSMQKYSAKDEFDLSAKYPLEYLIALVTGSLELPSKEGGCDNNCGVK